MQFEEVILDQLFGIKAVVTMSGVSDIEYENENGNIMLKLENQKASLYIANGSSGYVIEDSKDLTDSQKEQLVSNGYEV